MTTTQEVKIGDKVRTYSIPNHSGTVIAVGDSHLFGFSIRVQWDDRKPTTQEESQGEWMGWDEMTHV